MEYQKVSLATLANGAAVERFDDALHRVLENIQDPNTEGDEKREIVLRVTFEANSDRSKCRVKIRCASKLAAPAPWSSEIHVVGSGENVDAVEPNVRQGDIEEYLKQAASTEDAVLQLINRSAK